MTVDEIRQLIEQGEGLKIEFKSGWAKGIDETLVAFANTQGGVLLLGIDKQSRVVGISDQDWDDLQLRVANVCRSCQPPLAPEFERVVFEDKPIIVVRIERSMDVHQDSGGVTRVRVGSMTRAASQEELVRLLQDRGRFATDEMVIEDARFEDLQRDKLERHIQERLRTGAPRVANGRQTQEIAASLGLVKRKDDQWLPTMAGLLYFGFYPQQFIQQSTVRCIRLKGVEISSNVILDRAGLTGTLDEIIDAAVAFVGRNMRIVRAIGAVARDVPEYPLTAVREAVANAVVHRDYTIGGREVLIRMFDDRLEIASPGGLAGNVTEETLGERSFARNRRLAELAFEFGKAERAGTGIPRIKNELALLGSPPPKFIATLDTFTVILYSRHEGVPSSPRRSLDPPTPYLFHPAPRR